MKLCFNRHLRSSRKATAIHWLNVIPARTVTAVIPVRTVTGVIPARTAPGTSSVRSKSTGASAAKRSNENKDSDAAPLKAVRAKGRSPFRASACDYSTRAPSRLPSSSLPSSRDAAEDFSRFMSKPEEQAWRAVKRLARYPKDHKRCVLKYKFQELPKKVSDMVRHRLRWMQQNEKVHFGRSNHAGLRVQ